MARYTKKDSGRSRLPFRGSILILAHLSATRYMSFVIRASPIINTGQVSIGVTPVLVVPHNQSRRRVVLVNLSGQAIFIGNSNVTITTGQQLTGGPGQQLEIETTAAVYGVAKNAGNLISYLEETCIAPQVQVIE